VLTQLERTANKTGSTKKTTPVAEFCYAILKEDLIVSRRLPSTTPQSFTV
jgi:hypothetical protein